MGDFPVLDQPVCRVSNSSNITLTNAVTATLPFDTTDEDSDLMHFTSAANLTGTVAKSGTNQLVGTGTAFLTELSVGQVISVPGVATEKKVVIAIADNTHLTVASAFAQTASGQTAKRVNSAIVIRTPGVYVCSLFLRFAANVTGLREGDIWINDTTRLVFAELTPIAGGDPTPFGLTLPPFRFSRWDFIEIRAFQNSGGNLDIVTASPYSPVLAAFRVRS